MAIRNLDYFAIDHTPQTWERAVLSQVTVPAGGEVSGDRYLVISPATGVFLGQEGNIAELQEDDTTWEFETPQDNSIIQVIDEDKTYQFDGTDWAEFEGGAINEMVYTNTTANPALVINASDEITLPFVAVGEVGRVEIYDPVKDRTIGYDDDITLGVDLLTVTFNSPTGGAGAYNTKGYEAIVHYLAKKG